MPKDKIDLGPAISSVCQRRSLGLLNLYRLLFNVLMHPLQTSCQRNENLSTDCNLYDFEIFTRKRFRWFPLSLRGAASSHGAKAFVGIGMGDEHAGTLITGAKSPHTDPDGDCREHLCTFYGQ
jgi:hypothetical protein